MRNCYELRFFLTIVQNDHAPFRRRVDLKKNSTHFPIFVCLFEFRPSSTAIGRYATSRLHTDTLIISKYGSMVQSVAFISKRRSFVHPLWSVSIRFSHQHRLFHPFFFGDGPTTSNSTDQPTNRPSSVFHPLICLLLFYSNGIINGKKVNRKKGVTTK